MIRVRVRARCAGQTSVNEEVNGRANALTQMNHIISNFGWSLERIWWNAMNSHAHTLWR